MNELALFAGGGGGLLASKWILGWRTICYVEKETYCVEIIKARIQDGLLDDAPIWDDARTFDGRPWVGLVDVISAGFPCQPFSGAGLQLADRDERNGWPDTIRIIGEVEPEWVILENVTGLLSKSHGYFGQILRDLAESGYDARWDCIPASAIGANHQRDRVWIVAHSISIRSQTKAHRKMHAETQAARTNYNPWDAGQDAGAMADASITRDRGLSIRSRRQEQTAIYAYGSSQDVADTYPDEQQLHQSGEQEKIRERPDSERSSSDVPHTISAGLSQSKHEWQFRGSIAQSGWWGVEPALGRVANGVANRVDRLRAIGNGQVPAVAGTVWGLLKSCFSGYIE